MRYGRRLRGTISGALGLSLAGMVGAVAQAETTGVAVAEPVQVAALASQAIGAPEKAAARLVVARIDLSDQTMTVHVGNKLSYTFTVSTGRGSYHTPTGTWQAQWLSPHHRSKKYHNAPMPWSVFFYAGYAIHGTTEIGSLGQPASHGCIRLHPDNAKIFFDLVKTNGKANTRISVVD